jgi:hypothetical protein
VGTGKPPFAPYLPAQRILFGRADTAPGTASEIKTQPIPTALSRLDLKPMGLLELLIIILVLAAIFGGIAVSPLLFVLLIVVIFVLYTRGGFGYRRGGRL